MISTILGSIVVTIRSGLRGIGPLRLRLDRRFIARLVGRIPGIRRLAGVLFVATLLANAAPSLPAQSQGAGQPIWSGTSAGYLIQWTTADLSARSSAQTEAAGFSARQMARKDFAAIEKDSDSHCEYVRTFKLLSVVGSIVSYQDDYGLSCEQQAHPSGQSRFVAVDLSRSAAARRDLSDSTSLPAQLASLTDYFSPGDILKALLADPLVKKALDGQASPRSLAEFIAFLKENFPTVAEGEKQCYELDRDILTRFAFHHVEGDKVAVRLGLSGPEPCRDFLTQVGLLLPIPPSLKEALAKAGPAQEGFLMNRKIGASRETNLSFETKKRRGRT